jgi:5-(carboxyamino)imidazole ribonucleotide synthase
MKIGILGNGQLGQMMQKSVADLVDIEIALYDTRAHRAEALAAFIQSVDRIGYETENGARACGRKSLPKP